MDNAWISRTAEIGTSALSEPPHLAASLVLAEHRLRNRYLGTERAPAPLASILGGRGP